MVESVRLAMDRIDGDVSSSSMSRRVTALFKLASISGVSSLRDSVISSMFLAMRERVFMSLSSVVFMRAVISSRLAIMFLTWMLISLLVTSFMKSLR